MAYVSDSNLSQFWGLAKTYINGQDQNFANWQKTSTAGAVTCYPVPASPLEPTVNFSFTETGPAEGTKAPDNPSTITGVESITVTHCETVGVDSTDYTISLGGTYYGGTVDFAAGLMTVTWFEHTFDGTEGFYLESTDYETCSRIGTTLSGTALAPATQVISTSGIAACTHYLHRYDWGDRAQVSLHSSGYIRFFTPLTIASTVAELQAFFAQQYANGTPVKLAYPIASPYTVQLTPQQILSLTQADKYTPRLNTLYSDQSSIQVGYAKSQIQSELDITNAIISLGGNI